MNKIFVIVCIVIGALIGTGIGCVLNRHCFCNQEEQAILVAHYRRYYGNVSEKLKQVRKQIESLKRDEELLEEKWEQMPYWVKRKLDK